MNEMIDFTLREEHIKLLEQLNFYISYRNPYGEHLLPQVDTKRCFGNSTRWEETAEILQLKPQNGKDFSEEQILTCKRLVVELLPAMEVIFKYKTFRMGCYPLDKFSSAVICYKYGRNYLYVESLVLEIEKEVRMNWIEPLRSIAMNINCDEDDRLEVYKAFYNELSFSDPASMKEMNIPWLTAILNRLEILIQDFVEGSLFLSVQSKDWSLSDCYTLSHDGDLKWISGHGTGVPDSSLSFHLYAALHDQLRKSEAISKEKIESILKLDGKFGFKCTFKRKE